MDAATLFKRAASCDYPSSHTSSLVVRRLEHTRRVVRQHVPLLTKALLGATFVEDAVRLLYQVLDAEPLVKDFKVVASHQESLHSHDAVSVIVKGIEGGFSAEIGRNAARYAKSGNSLMLK